MLTVFNNSYSRPNFYDIKKFISIDLKPISKVNNGMFIS